jgi:CHRD domain
LFPEPEGTNLDLHAFLGRRVDRPYNSWKGREMMRNRTLFVAAILAMLLMLAVGLFVLGCGGATTTTQNTTATTLATTTTAGSAGGPGGAAPVRIVVPLTGAEVVPPVQTSGSGTFTLLVEALPSGSFNISFELDVKDIVDVTAAHIHLGAMGAEGPVIVPLFIGPAKTGSFSGVLAQGSLAEKDLVGPLAGKTFQELSGAVLAGQAYVNVHTKAYPNGEIRGQIILSTTGASTETTVSGGATTTTSAGSGY